MKKSILISLFAAAAFPLGTVFKTRTFPDSGKRVLLKQ